MDKEEIIIGDLRMNNNQKTILSVINNLLNQNQLVTLDSIKDNLNFIISKNKINLTKEINQLVKNNLIQVN